MCSTWWRVGTEEHIAQHMCLLFFFSPYGLLPQDAIFTTCIRYISSHIERGGKIKQQLDGFSLLCGMRVTATRRAGARNVQNDGGSWLMVFGCCSPNWFSFRFSFLVVIWLVCQLFHTYTLLIQRPTPGLPATVEWPLHNLKLSVQLSNFEIYEIKTINFFHLAFSPICFSALHEQITPCMKLELNSIQVLNIPPITYYCTEPLISDHSYIVGNLTKFKNCWNKSFRTSKILTLLYLQFSNSLISQRDMSGPRLGALSNNRWSGCTKMKTVKRISNSPYNCVHILILYH